MRSAAREVGMWRGSRWECGGGAWAGSSASENGTNRPPQRAGRGEAGPALPSPPPPRLAEPSREPRRALLHNVHSHEERKRKSERHSAEREVAVAR